jgi:hypothetical protein
VPIPSLTSYQRPRDPERPLFDDLPVHQQIAARRWLTRWELRYRARHHRRVPNWCHAILVAKARRFAVDPPGSAWGRSMRAKKGGHAVQRRYRAEGRHPTAKATAVRESRRGRSRSAAAPSVPQHATTAQPYAAYPLAPGVPAPPANRIRTAADVSYRGSRATRAK